MVSLALSLTNHSDLSDAAPHAAQLYEGDTCLGSPKRRTSFAGTIAQPARDARKAPGGLDTHRLRAARRIAPSTRQEARAGMSLCSIGGPTARDGLPMPRLRQPQ